MKQKKLLLFAGTTEGRALAQALAGWGGLALTACVATDYGEEGLCGLPCRILTGRMGEAEMAALMGEGFGLVVDATHPYAREATRHIAGAAHRAGLPCLRLARGESDAGDCLRVSSLGEAARALADTQGNILLATGAKELDAFAALPGYRDRCFVRVLPALESLERCLALGYRREHILAMQGPFSRELNAAVLREWDIRYLVTKDGGVPGGFAQKQEAARETGARLVLVERPPDGGLSLEACLEEIRRWWEETP